jgi:hypothetical protein
MFVLRMAPERVALPLAVVDYTSLKGNHHGPLRPRGPDGEYRGSETLTDGALLVRMGSRCMSWGLWVYRKDASCFLISFTIPGWKTPMPRHDYDRNIRLRWPWKK